MIENYKTCLKLCLGTLLTLGSTLAHADAVWQGTVSAELSTAANWSSSTLPNSATLADFGSSPISGYSLTATLGGLTALGIVFEPPASSYTLTADSQAITIGTSGVVNNSSVSQTLATEGLGASISIAAVPGGVNSAGDGVNYTIGGTASSLTFEGETIGTGLVTLDAYTTFYVDGNSSIGSLTSDSVGAEVILNADLTITAMPSVYYTGAISGTGAFIVSALTASPFEYLYMEGPNTYTGGTVLNGGILYPLAPLPVDGTVTVNGGVLAVGADQVIGNLSGVGGSINWVGTADSVVVNQTSNATFAGTLISPNPLSSFTLGTPSSTTAIGTLQLTGISNGFLGAVTVDSGNLQVNGLLTAGSILVNAGGTLSGTGTIGATGITTTIASAGTLSPGNSVGVLTNAGNQVFNAGSFFTLQEDGFTSTPTPPGSNSLLIVDGTTTVGVGGTATVNLVPVNDLINFNTKQAFIESEGGLTVTTPFALNFATALTTAGFNLELFDPTLSFDANNYYITTQTDFAAAVAADGGDRTAVTIAGIFDSISNPNTPQNLLLNSLAKLPTDELTHLFDNAGGANYATQVYGIEIANRQFLRRLYDPIRAIVTTEPNQCCCPMEQECCEPWSCSCEDDACCAPLGLDVWASAGGGQTRVRHAKHQRHHNMTFDEWDVTVGIQDTFCQDWTIGLAGSYEGENIQHHRRHGSGHGHTWFGGLYGLYRPACWYALADVAYSYTKHKLNRRLFLGDFAAHFRARPHISQVTFYGEAGFDWNLCNFLVQPFIGVEVARFNRKHFAERDLFFSGFSLDVNRHNRTFTIGSLGVHLTDHFCSGFSLSLDLAWLYRFTERRHFEARLATFAPFERFEVRGPEVGRNGGAGALTFTKDFDNNWRVFIEASGEVWRKVSTYNVLCGFQANW
jgi:uncharacterized protein with beta-barrel porin domain